MKNNFQNDNKDRSSSDERPATDRIPHPAENDEELMDDLFDTHAKLAERGGIDQP